MENFTEIEKLCKQLSGKSRSLTFEWNVGPMYSNMELFLDGQPIAGLIREVEELIDHISEIIVSDPVAGHFILKGTLLYDRRTAGLYGRETYKNEVTYESGSREITIDLKSKRIDIKPGE